MEKGFKCCGSKEFRNYCCVTCTNIFHPSCLERYSGWLVVGGFKIFCSHDCQKKHLDNEEDRSKMKLELDRLTTEIAQRDMSITRLKRSTKDFEDELFQSEN